MTNDTQSPPLGMHPDQHAIAFSPTNPDIAFLGSDGGVVRTSGQFADASADCDGRGISGADLIDCKAWLAAIPTTITSLNDGLRTLQFQSVSLDANHPRAEPARRHAGQRHVGVQRQGQVVVRVGRRRRRAVGIDVGNAEIRMHTYIGPQGDVNFRGNDPLGWNWWGDVLECQRRSRFLLCAAHQRSEGRRHLVHRPAARLAHEGQRRQPGVPRTALQRVLRRLHGRVRRLGAVGRCGRRPDCRAGVRQRHRLRRRH